MDRYAGAATLEWWANRSTCLGRVGVRVDVCVAGRDWTCEAILEPTLSPEERANFDFLVALDPLFTLRFDEGSTLHVDVAAADEGGRLVLTVHRAEAAESTRTRRLPE